MDVGVLYGDISSPDFRCPAVASVSRIDQSTRFAAHDEAVEGDILYALIIEGIIPDVPSGEVKDGAH